MSDRRSKVSRIPDPEPVKPMTLLQRLSYDAAQKAYRAYRRHGEGSYQFWKAMRSRWLARNRRTGNITAEGQVAA